MKYLLSSATYFKVLPVNIKEEKSDNFWEKKNKKGRRICALYTVKLLKSKLIKTTLKRKDQPMTKKTQK